MVEHTIQLDSVFGSLADPTRRDILRRVAKKELSIGEIAKPYALTFAAISKHLKILEKAKLIIKHRRGREQLVRLFPPALQGATEYLSNYEAVWNQRFDALDEILKTEKKKLNKK
jgi:DNA-binding transcriptional ArsR family regulator